MNHPTLTAAEETRYAELQAHALDLARAGDVTALCTMVAAGLPANLRDAKGQSLLMLAAYHGHTDTVRMLLRAGADADGRNDRGQTPLGGAAFKGHDEVVTALLQAGADPEANQGFGLGPIGTAMMFGRFGTAKIIRRFVERRREHGVVAPVM